MAKAEQPQQIMNDTPRELDPVCEHGTAMDVHCCNCHGGFLFNSSGCECRFEVADMTLEQLVDAAKRADWMQVVLNQGPPCFHYYEDYGKFCLCAQRWAGHGDGEPPMHPFVSLETLLARVFALGQERERERQWQPIGTMPDDYKRDGTTILRPHTIYGAMDVRWKPGIYDGKPMDWVNGDYTTAWPELAFWPFWMPLPPSPPGVTP